MKQDIDFNDLEFLEILGSGAFGKVSLVKHLPTSEYFAIKSFEKKKLSESQISSIYCEGQILASLNHPNIVRFYKLYSTESNLYILMEYIKYGTLNNYFKIKKNSQLTDKEVKQFMKALLSSIGYLHQRNIIHRDIKPDNILIADENNLSKIKLADFGLSSQFERNQFATFNRKCGTLYYMSPEYFDTYNRCTKAVDVYSCGVLLYELTHNGRHPFLTKTIKSLSKIKKYITSGVYNKFSCSPEFETIICRMTIKQQSERLSIEQALGAFTNNKIPSTLSEMMQGMDKQYKIQRMIQAMIFIKWIIKKASHLQLLSSPETTPIEEVNKTTSRKKIFNQKLYNQLTHYCANLQRPKSKTLKLMNNNSLKRLENPSYYNIKTEESESHQWSQNNSNNNSMSSPKSKNSKVNFINTQTGRKSLFCNQKSSEQEISQENKRQSYCSSTKNIYEERKIGCFSESIEANPPPEKYENNQYQIVDSKVLFQAQKEIKQKIKFANNKVQNNLTKSSSKFKPLKLELSSTKNQITYSKFSPIQQKKKLMFFEAKNKIQIGNQECLLPQIMSPQSTKSVSSPYLQLPFNNNKQTLQFNTSQNRFFYPEIPNKLL